MTRIFRICFWLAIAGVVFVTVSPIGMRPRDIASMNIDRAAAFAVVGALLILAYPRHWRLVAALVVSGAVASELLQDLSPTRHASLKDALVKGAGAAGGVALGLCIRRLRGRGERGRSARF